MRNNVGIVCPFCEKPSLSMAIAAEIATQNGIHKKQNFPIMRHIEKWRKRAVTNKNRWIAVIRKKLGLALFCRSGGVFLHASDSGVWKNISCSGRAETFKTFQKIIRRKTK